MATRKKEKRKESRWLGFAVIATAVTGLLVLCIELLALEFPGKYIVEWLDLLAVALLGVFLFVEFARADSKKTFLKRHWLDIAVIVPFLVALRVLRAFRAELVLGQGAARVLIGVAEPGVLMIERARKATSSVVSLKTVAEVVSKIMRV